MATNPSAIVDAVAADMVALGLGQVGLWKYTEIAVLDEAVELPILAVWCPSSRFSPLTSGDAANPGAFLRNHVIEIAFYVFDTAINNHGFQDGPEYLALEATQQRIVDAVALYDQGVPAFGTQIVGTLQEAKPEPVDPGMWRTIVTLDVAEMA